MTEQRVLNISVVVDAPFTVHLEDRLSGVRKVWSSSPVILRTLLSALMTDSVIEVEMAVNDPNMIHRVHPFLNANGLIESTGEFMVRRIATQSGANGTDEHLEIFLQKDGGNEKSYNVFNLHMQQLFVAAFQSNAPKPITVSIKLNENNEIHATTIERISTKFVTRDTKPND